MKIESIHIKNFRTFSDATVQLSNYTCLVGANGCGKSTILSALNVFFRETSGTQTDVTVLDREDFHHKNTDEPIEITVTFVELNAAAQTDFADYYRQKRLVISAIAQYDTGTGRAEVKQYGQRLAMKQFAPYFKANGDKASAEDLRKIYADIKKEFAELKAATTKPAMEAALREYENSHGNECTLIRSEDQFYGVSKGTNRLAKYVQWVYVPAVKDATTEQIEGKNTALGKLLARTVRAKTNFDEEVKVLRAKAQADYQILLEKNQDALKDLSTTLGEKLSQWSHPDTSLKVEWQQDPDKSVRVEDPLARVIAGEGPFEGDLARFGHGLQRSYLLALLQELALTNDAEAPRLILGIEEPELYQHPPQARHLASVLGTLSDGNAQILVCTHSPLFVSGEGFENVRMVRKDRSEKNTKISHITFAELGDALAGATGEKPAKPNATLAKIHQALQPHLSEMFFASTVVFTEGLEDVAYITTYLNLMGQWDEFRRMGSHFVPVNKKSHLLQPVAIAKHLKIPTYILFDADGDKVEKEEHKKVHENDNKALLKILGVKEPEPFPKEPYWGIGFVVWPTDIGKIVSDEIGKADWARFQQEADTKYGHGGGLKKNTLHIAASLDFAWQAGKKSASLEKLCGEILNTENRIA